MDRQCFNTDLDPVPTPSLHMLENHFKKFNSASLHCLIFLVSFGVIVFNILDSILEIFGIKVPVKLSPLRLAEMVPDPDRQVLGTIPDPYPPK